MTSLCVLNDLVVHDLVVRVSGKRLLDRVSFKLARGELSVLLGPNGAGKSTLLRALIGEIPAESGRVELVGQDLSSYTPFARARAITLVPQEQPVDFPLRVAELVELGRLPHSAKGRCVKTDQSAIWSALERTDLLHLTERDVRSLSGGERQRVSLARALAQQTPVLLLDEPTTHLDIAHQIAMLETVRSLVRSGGSVLVALHDLGLAARFADRVLVLENGGLTANGTPREVLTRERLEQSFGITASIEEDGQGQIRHLTVLGKAPSFGASPC